MSPYGGGWYGPSPPSASGGNRATIVVVTVAVVVVIGLLAALAVFGSNHADDESPYVPVRPNGGVFAPPPDPSDSALAHDRAAGPPVSGGQVVFGLDYQPLGFNPASAGYLSTANMIVAQAVLDPLTAFDESLTARPFLARALTPSPDLRQWTITLRPGVVFHDGTPCDATAVKLALDLFRRQTSFGRMLAPIADITVSDDLHLVVTLTQAWATFPQVLTGQAGLVAAKAVYDEVSNHVVIGTGPFIMDRFTEGTKMIVRKNPHYWQPGKPYLDQVTFEVDEDSSERWDRLRSSAVDLIHFQGVSRAGAGDPIDVFTDEHQNPGRDVFVLSTTTEPFNDVVARQAVSAAIDRTEIGGSAAVGYLGVNSPLFSADPDAVQRYEPDKARQLVDRYTAAHGRPLSFTMITAPDAVATVTTVQRQLRAFGITMTIHTEPPVDQVNDMFGGTYQAAYWLLFGGPSPETTVLSLIGENPIPTNGQSYNFPHDADPALLDAFARYRATADPEAQRRAMADVQKVVATQAPWIFLDEDRRGLAVSTHVHGALDYRLPDGETGFPTMRPFVGNLWRSP